MRIGDTVSLALCSTACQRAAWLELASACASGQARCSSAAADRRRRHIGFELYMCTTPLIGDIVARVRPAAMVHQRITQDAVRQWEQLSGADDSDDGTAGTIAFCRRLTGGVLWNDMPTPDCGDAHYELVHTSARAVRALYERHRHAFSCGCAQCERLWCDIDSRFCYNAPAHRVVTMCIALRVPLALSGAFDASRCAVEAHRGDRAHIHAMVGDTRAEVRMSVREKRDRIVAQLCAWARYAVRTRDVFYTGHCLHTAQDAYAEQHVERRRHSGAIVRFHRYSVQEARDHARADTMQAYAHSAAKHRMIAACVLFLRHFAAGDADTTALERTLRAEHFKLVGE